MLNSDTVHFHKDFVIIFCCGVLLGKERIKKLGIFPSLKQIYYRIFFCRTGKLKDIFSNNKPSMRLIEYTTYTIKADRSGKGAGGHCPLSFKKNVKNALSKITTIPTSDCIFI